MMACALTRHVPAGSVAGRKTVNERPASAWSQLAMVLGVPGPDAGVADAVAVAVALTEATGVVVAVALVLGLAPSSRKTMDGLLHQCRSASGSAAVAVVGVFCPPPPPPPLTFPKGFEQEASSSRNRIERTTSVGEASILLPRIVGW